MTNNLTRLQQLSPGQRVLLLQKMQVVRAQQAMPAWSPLVPLQVNPTEPPLFFLHASGGALFWYLTLLKHLGDSYNAYGLQGHGLYGDQQPLASISAMTEAYLPLIRAQQATGPYALVGYSFGGVIAFDVAQQLRAAGEQVSQLFLLDAYLYTERLPYPGKEIADEDERLLARMLGSLPADQRSKTYTQLRKLPNHRARIDYLFQNGRAIGRIPATYTITDLRRMYDAMEAHVEALAAYQPQPYAGSVTFLRCTDRSESDIIPARPWSTIVRGGITTYDVPGKHTTLLEEPNVRVVAQILQSCLTAEARVR